MFRWILSTTVPACHLRMWLWPHTHSISKLIVIQLLNPRSSVRCVLLCKIGLQRATAVVATTVTLLLWLCDGVVASVLDNKVRLAPCYTPQTTEGNACVFVSV